MRAEDEAPQDTLRRTLLHRMARSFGTLAKHARPAIRRRHRCPHPFTRYFGYQTTKRAGYLASQGSSPLQQFSRFFRRFGSGSRSRFVTTAIDGYQKSSGILSVYVRVGPDRQMREWSVSNSNNRQTEPRRASSLRATKRSSPLCRAALFVLFGSLTSKSFHLIRASFIKSASGHI